MITAEEIHNRPFLSGFVFSNFEGSIIFWQDDNEEDSESEEEDDENDSDDDMGDDFDSDEEDEDSKEEEEDSNEEVIFFQSFEIWNC